MWMAWKYWVDLHHCLAVRKHANGSVYLIVNRIPDSSDIWASLPNDIQTLTCGPWTAFLVAVHVSLHLFPTFFSNNLTDFTVLCLLMSLLNNWFFVVAFNSLIVFTDVTYILREKKCFNFTLDYTSYNTLNLIFFKSERGKKILF